MKREKENYKICQQKVDYRLLSFLNGKGKWNQWKKKKGGGKEKKLDVNFFD